jgi:hypothetical protein
MLAGQNARPMVLNCDDLTPALGQRSIRQVSPVGSGYAAGNVIARERLAFQWIQWPSQAWESLADGRAWPEPSSTGAFGGRNSPRVSRLSGGRVCHREFVAVPVASGDVLRKLAIRKWNCFSVDSVNSVRFRGISRVGEVILASFTIGLVFADLASLAS